MKKLIALPLLLLAHLACASEPYYAGDFTLRKKEGGEVIIGVNVVLAQEQPGTTTVITIGEKTVVGPGTAKLAYSTSQFYESHDRASDGKRIVDYSIFIFITDDQLLHVSAFSDLCGDFGHSKIPVTSSTIDFKRTSEKGCIVELTLKKH